MSGGYALLLTVPLAPDHDYSAAPLAPRATDPEPASPHLLPWGEWALILQLRGYTVRSYRGALRGAITNDRVDRFRRRSVADHSGGIYGMASCETEIEPQDGPRRGPQAYPSSL
jgi:hypothetical protein